MTELLKLLRSDTVELAKLAVVIVLLACALRVWRSNRPDRPKVLWPLLTAVALLPGCSADLINFALKMGPLGVETKLTVRDLETRNPPTTQPAIPPGAP